jgi:hypothetical protein
MAHEAKPHLPGAVLILLAIIAGTKFVETKSWRWAIFCGALCGAAFGMVLSALLGFVILPLMVLLVEMKWSKRLGVLIASALIGIGVYAITNPFVVVHLFGNPQMLRSNLGNSSAMYQAPFTFGGFINAIELIAAGATPVLAIVGIVGVILIVRRRLSAAWLIGGVWLLVLVQFVLLATGKPGEYARFALLPDIALGIAAVVLIGSISERGIRYLLLAILCISTGIWGAGYVWGFLRDSIPRTTRIIVAERVAGYKNSIKTIAVDAEPAPYSFPPANLFDLKIVLTGADHQPPAGADIHLRTVDFVGAKAVDSADEYWIRPRLLPTPISWAAKPFRITFLKGVRG